MIRSIALVCVFLLLSACAAVPKLPPEEMAKSYGFVTAQFVTNAPSVTAFLTRFATMEVQDEKGDKFQLNDASPGGRYSQTFSGWLPAGTYRITRLMAMLGAMSAEMNGVQAMVAPFKVTAGAQTDLGTLMFQPVERNAATILPLKDARTPAEVMQFLPPAVAKVINPDKLERALSKPVLPVVTSTTWTSNSSPYGGLIGALIMTAITVNADSKMGPAKRLTWADVKEAGEIDQLAKGSVTILNGGSELPNGRAVFGSRLGVLLLREPDGRWQLEDTGTHSEISATLYEEGSQLIGTEHGRIGVREAAGWSFVPAARADQAIVYMTREKPGAILFAAYSRATGDPVVELFRFTTADRQSTSLGKVEISASLVWSPQPFHSGDFIGRVGNQILFGKDSDMLTVYDLTTATWRDEKSPDSYQRLHTSVDESVAVLVDNFGMARNHFLKAGNGNWTRFEGPHMMFDAQFVDAQRGYGTLMKVGVFSGGWAILRTEDGGKTWTEGQQTKEGCTSIRLLQRAGRILCSTVSGALISSTDGNEWTPERGTR